MTGARGYFDTDTVLVFTICSLIWVVIETGVGEWEGCRYVRGTGWSFGGEWSGNRAWR